MKTTNKITIVLACCLGLAVSPKVPVWAAPTNSSLLSNGGFERDNDGWQLPGERADASYVAAPASVGGRALKLNVRPVEGGDPWSVMMRQPIDATFAAGDAMTLKMWARSPQSIRIAPYIEANDAYTKFVGEPVDLTPAWKLYSFEGKANKALKAGESSLVMHFGYAAGDVEIAGVELTSANAKSTRIFSTATPDKPESLVGNGNFADIGAKGAPTAWNWGDGKIAEVKVVPALIAGSAAKSAVRLQLDPPVGANPWDYQMAQSVNAGIARGDAVYARFWARSPDKARLSAIYEMSGEPHTKTISAETRLTPDWKEYRFAGNATQGFGPGDSQFKFFLGYDKGTIEIADVRVENYGAAPPRMFSQTIDYWNGEEHNDEWRAAALKRIEQIRKGDVRVRVEDKLGHPVAGANVAIEQQRHDFRWGTAGPVSRLLDDTSPDSLRYQAEVLRLFNTFTPENDLKWRGKTEAEIEQTEAAIDWLRSHHIEVRGHNLVWGSDKYLPGFTKDLPADQLKRAVVAHVEDYAERFKGKVYAWDVVNEATDNTQLWEKIGWPEFSNVYNLTHKIDPNALLAYNDYHLFHDGNGPDSIRAKEMARIKGLIDGGAKVDVLAEQAHMGPKLIALPTVLKNLDQLAAFGKPIEITEYDLGVPDDTVHGDYTRDFLIAAFSHPKVVSFIEWGFWEGAHWRAADGGAMFRKDWSKRPAQLAYEDLVLNQWWTRAKGTTDANGNYATRAFYGTQLVSVTKDGVTTQRTLNLKPNGDGDIVIQLLD